MAKNVFDKQKESALDGVDLSRKGSVDEKISELVAHLNSSPTYFTTSSCSGRIIVFEDEIVEKDGKASVKKKGCKWLYTSHDKVQDSQQITDALKDIAGDVVFKFEPFVLHVQCRTIDHAQSLLCSAVSSGFRNSGISLGNKGKILVAVRSTHGLEAPLSKDGNLMVPESYLDYLTELANNKLEENFKRIDRFFESVQQIKETSSASNAVTHKNKKKSRSSGKQKSDIVVNKRIPSDNRNSSVENIEECLVECNLFDDIT